MGRQGTCTLRPRRFVSTGVQTETCRRRNGLVGLGAVKWTSWRYSGQRASTSAWPNSQHADDKRTRLCHVRMPCWLSRRAAIGTLRTLHSLPDQYTRPLPSALPSRLHRPPSSLKRLADGAAWPLALAARRPSHLQRLSGAVCVARAPVHASRQGAHIKVQLAAARRAAEIHEPSIERFPTCGSLKSSAPAYPLIGCALALPTTLASTRLILTPSALYKASTRSYTAPWPPTANRRPPAALLCCPLVFPPQRPWNCLGPSMQGTTPAVPSPSLQPFSSLLFCSSSFL
jgi:hypothetical protein